MAKVKAKSPRRRRDELHIRDLLEERDEATRDPPETVKPRAPVPPTPRKG